MPILRRDPRDTALVGTASAVRTLERTAQDPGLASCRPRRVAVSARRRAVLAASLLVAGLFPALAPVHTVAAAATHAPSGAALGSSLGAALASPSPSPGLSSPSPNPSGVAPTPTPTASPASAIPAGAVPPPDGPLPVLGGLQAVQDVVTFFGRGYGHGVGMSQWGARGRALAGQTAEMILAHYYENTMLSTVDPATPVRVLLRAGFVTQPTRPAVVTGRSGPWTVDGLPNVFPADAALAVWRDVTGWQLTVTGPDGSQLAAVTGLTDVRLRAAAPETRFQVAIRSSRTYRGTIHLIANPMSAKVTAVNEIGLDEYLLGVVPTEMPYTWPVEALRAQVVAARTYAARRLHPTTGTFDLYDDTRSQIYRGVGGEKPNVSAIIVAYPGQVLVLPNGRLANTPYHASDGGATENNENVYTRADGSIYVQPSPELRGSSDRMPDGTPYDAAAPLAHWQSATLTVDQLSAIVDADPRTNVGVVTAIDLSGRGVSGRLIRVTLIGTTGTKTVSGNLFLAIFDAGLPTGMAGLRSTLFDLAPIN